MIVVTGGAGFIGSNVVAALTERGDRNVVVCDRLRSGQKWRNIAKHNILDVIPPEQLPAFLDSQRQQVKAIVHMGAISTTTETDADLIFRTNFSLSLGLWRWCAGNRVRFIYASSAATYGSGELGFDDNAAPEHQAKLRPLNPYGWSKLQFDRRVAHEIATDQPRPPQHVGLKFFNVYGPNEYHKGPQQSVVAQVFPVAKAGEPYALFKSHNPAYADGGQLRDFIWVGDVVDVILWLLDHEEVSGLFNVGTGKADSFLNLASAVYQALGQDPKITFRDTPEAIRAHYQYFTEAAMLRLRTAGYDKPFTPLAEGVRRYVQDYLNTADPYR